MYWPSSMKDYHSLFPENRHGPETYLAELQGIEISVPNDPDWEHHSSAYNQRVPVEPRIVFLPNTVDQVSAAVRWAHICGYPVQARSGGHSYASHSTGGVNGTVVIDLRALRDIYTYLRQTRVEVGGGARLGNLTLSLWRRHGSQSLALAHGTCPTVSVGGHYTHGGYGLLSRTWGLAMDQIEALDVVMADGTVVKASASENADLFMAMRGAADSFGIAVNFHLRATRFVETFLGIQEFANNDANRYVNLLIFFDHNRLHIVGVYYSSSDFHSSVLEPLLRRCPAIERRTVQFQRYTWRRLSELLADTPDGLSSDIDHKQHTTLFAKSSVVSNPGLIRAELEDYFSYMRREGPSAPIDYFVVAQLYGGRDSQITANNAEDAYAHRNAMWMFQHTGYARSGETFPDEGIRFIEGLHRALGLRHGASNNYPDPSLDRDEAHRLYYGEKLEKLQELKARFDPKNTFSHPQSIQPIEPNQQGKKRWIDIVT